MFFGLRLKVVFLCFGGGRRKKGCILAVSPNPQVLFLPLATSHKTDSLRTDQKRSVWNVGEKKSSLRGEGSENACWELLEKGKGKKGGRSFSSPRFEKGGRGERTRELKMIIFVPIGSMKENIVGSLHIKRLFYFCKWTPPNIGNSYDE